jgi:branched-chain amino acid transport system substrate-binding protein
MDPRRCKEQNKKGRQKMNSKLNASMAALAGLLAIAASIPANAADKKYSTGASDTEIKIGHTTAYSGPVSAFSAAGRTLSAYFKMVNEAGGINGRRVNIISLDDAYSPPKTVEQTRKLVEEDEVLLIYGVSGSPTNAATQKYLNGKGVPQILIATGAAKFNDPKAFPWTMPFWPTYQLEQKTYGDYIRKVKPNAKVAILFANDDYGKDHLAGIKAALSGDKGASIVAEVSYDTSAPTIDSQIVNLKASGADVFISATTPKFAAQAIRKAKEIGWTPLQFVANASSSISAVLLPAGAENSTGVITAAFIKSPGDPVWADSKDVKEYVDFMKKWNSQDSPYDFYATVAYVNAVMLHHILKSCGDDLTRENVMKQVGNIHDVHLPLHLPKIVLKTTPDDLSAFRALQLQRFDGQKWVDIEE